MAGARNHKIGTIFERATMLLEAGAYRTTGKPIWYDVYAQHPPISEPRYDRQPPSVQVKSIFYEEDIIRAKIHNAAQSLRFQNLDPKAKQSTTQNLIRKCQEIMKVKGVSVDEAIKMMNIGVRKAKTKKTEVPETEVEVNEA